MNDHYVTEAGIKVLRSVEGLPYESGLEIPLAGIDKFKGAVFASGYEYPGRYSRWDIAFLNPPLQIIGYDRKFQMNALNERGKILLGFLYSPLSQNPHLVEIERTDDQITGKILPMSGYFPEEERSKQPSFFSIIRTIIKLFGSEADLHLGLYGAFGYDLAFQFEPIRLKHQRPAFYKEAHLFLPDELILVDHRKETAQRRCYDFIFNGQDTLGLERNGDGLEVKRGEPGSIKMDHEPGEYADKVRQVQEGCRKGDFFEVVPSQLFYTGYAGTAGDLFHVVRKVNPSPYEFLINMGDEQLVGSSPEMFVRVEGDFVETCPISGTIARGRDAMEDSDQIRTLLNSIKDESELTMVTDVDRNDKSRICKPGTVNLKGRRLIETYSRLFHTVDHVTGTLRKDCDSLDAFLSHMWAVTLTGAPKRAAMQRIEELENSPREWYGGAIGFISFNGNLNTGITIRTIHLKDGLARVRVGATLLVDSDPDEEEKETRLKAAAFIDAVLGKKPPERVPFVPSLPKGKAPKILFVDHEDSFVHTLANYVRQTGAQVMTLRAGFPLEILDQEKWDMIFLSPGPGRPSDFGVANLVKACAERILPVFGVCLGLQGMVEAFGGRLSLLDYPMHGKPSMIRNNQKGIFEGFPETFKAGRYHSIFARMEDLPSCLEKTAVSDDQVVMGIAHKELPMAAVQFHPESILTLKDDLGLKLLNNVVRLLGRPKL
ncbi:MAG: anthranilate synthase component I [Deltaproteobacteria bacterium]|nr:anthranilate synthase component I [Deltaproteobacteria bacterium]